MFSVNVWNSRLKCCHHTPTRGDCSVMSSRTSGQPLRRPNGRTCWDGDAAPPADDDWRNVDADDWRRQRRTYSSPPGTGELCVVDIDELSDRAWTELVWERRASASRQGHQLWCQSKAHMQLILVINSNFGLSCTVLFLRYWRIKVENS